MSKVFITQQAPGLDFSQAEDFGRVVTIWPHNAQAWSDTTHLADVCTKALASYDPEVDYLLPCGDPALMCMAAAEAALLTGGRVRLLKWDRRKGASGGYRVVNIDLGAA